MATMRWELSDGTVVTSDGKAITVAGTSDFADYLRYRMAQPELRVPEFPAPSGEVPLDPSRARNINAWLEEEIAQDDDSVLIRVRPEIEPLPPAPEDGNPLTVY